MGERRKGMLVKVILKKITALPRPAPAGLRRRPGAAHASPFDPILTSSAGFR
jgi:hypothetical protein